MSGAAIVHPKLAKAGFTKAIRPLLDKPTMLEKFGVRLVDFSFPFLDVEVDWHLRGRKLLLRVDGTDYPYRAVGGWWISSDGQRLTPGAQQIPQNQGFHTADLDNRPGSWFCFKGWREFHDHPGHQDVSWATLRRSGGFTVLQLLTQLQIDLNKPEVVLV